MNDRDTSRFAVTVFVNPTARTPINLGFLKNRVWLRPGMHISIPGAFPPAQSSGDVVLQFSRAIDAGLRYVVLSPEGTHRDCSMEHRSLTEEASQWAAAVLGTEAIPTKDKAIKCIVCKGSGRYLQRRCQRCAGDGREPVRVTPVTSAPASPVILDAVGAPLSAPGLPPATTETEVLDAIATSLSAPEVVDANKTPVINPDNTVLVPPGATDIKLPPKPVYAPSVQSAPAPEMKPPELPTLDDAVASEGATLREQVLARKAEQAKAPKVRVNPVGPKGDRSADQLREEMRGSTVHGSDSLGKAVKARDANRGAKPDAVSTKEYLGRTPDANGVVDMARIADPMSPGKEVAGIIMPEVPAVPGPRTAAPAAPEVLHTNAAATLLAAGKKNRTRGAKK